MTNELMGIVGVAIFTGFLFLLQHAICFLGRRRRRTHGTYIMPLGKTDLPPARPVKEKPEAVDRFNFQCGMLNHSQAWFTSMHGVSALALPPGLPPVCRWSSR